MNNELSASRVRQLEQREPDLQRPAMSSQLLLLSRFTCVRLCATLQTAAHQAPPSLGFSRQEYWSGVPLPSPNVLSNLL